MRMNSGELADAGPDGFGCGVVVALALAPNHAGLPIRRELFLRSAVLADGARVGRLLPPCAAQLRVEKEMQLLFGEEVGEPYDPRVAAQDLRLQSRHVQDPVKGVVHVPRLDGFGCSDQARTSFLQVTQVARIARLRADISHERRVVLAAVAAVGGGEARAGGILVVAIPARVRATRADGPDFLLVAAIRADVRHLVATILAIGIPGHREIQATSATIGRARAVLGPCGAQ
mmetsp:Transcript_40294/g.110934  ORF Transcript_40294/g.110934 Transcript_40294/m.110934 type:complete len:231 (-) Transcript_40294:66-758(-)